MNKLFFCLFITMTYAGVAQEKYPVEILPGKTVNVKATTDTLWILDDETMDQYMKYWVDLQYADSNNMFYTREIKTLEKVIQYKNEAVKNKNKEVNALKADKDALTEEKKTFDRKLHKSKRFGFFGTATGAIVGFILGWLVFQ